MIYVHVPFCRSFCTYCGFYSEIPGRGRAGTEAFRAYAEAISSEADSRRSEIEASLGHNTLYIGGGTPSVLPLPVMRTIVEALPYGPFEEFTVEVNPEDIVTAGPDYVKALLGLGVTRISMGVQSFDDGMLRFMNRRHSAAGALRAYSILRDAGVRDISIDLIFGLSLMDEGIWRRTLDTVSGMDGSGKPEHISAYQLSVEGGSVLESMLNSGRYSEADEEMCRRQYDMLCGCLSDLGYRHYEISNFAVPGHEARHNSAYWSRRPYVGLGAGAHSYDGTVRSWNGELGSGTGQLPYSREKEALTEEDVRTERIMLGLRTSEGVGESLLEGSAPEVIDRLLADGSLVSYRDGKGAVMLRIPENRFFVSDEIIRELI